MNSIFDTLADRQLHLMIQRGKLQDECRAEWRKRWGIDYPYYKAASGIKKFKG